MRKRHNKWVDVHTNFSQSYAALGATVSTGTFQQGETYLAGVVLPISWLNWLGCGRRREG